MRKKKSDFSFLDMTKEILLTSEKPLSINEIWDMAENKGIIDKVGSSGKTPMKTLSARLYLDIRDNEKSEFVQVSKRPSLFYLKDKKYKDTEESSTLIDEVEESKKFNERDLHVLLSTFVLADASFKCLTKTIFHEKSIKGKKGYNQWLHPDLVGIYFPFQDFAEDTLKLQEVFNDKAFKLFSFEVKIRLNFANLRESYFQAVSNSSWANAGYLVTLFIEEDESFFDELKRLNNAFGIGIIKLDPKNISQSEVVFQAKEKEFLDWDTIDRLITENDDFSKFVNDLMDDIKVGRAKSKYDKTFNDDIEAANYATDKKIIIK